MVRSAPARTLLFLTLVATAAGVGAARRPGAGGFSADDLGEIRRLVEAEQTRQRIPGLTVAIATPAARWSEGFGLADLEAEVPATERTVYRLASLAKPITAVAALQLAEAGQLDLDAPIQRYVPRFPTQAWPVTPQHLLAHQGGIRWYRGDEMHSTTHYTDLITPLDQFADDPLEFEPGTRFLYSTYGYNLLGAAVESAAGRPYLEVLRESIFRPVGMSATQVDDSTALIPYRARGYRKSTQGDAIEPARLADTSNKIPGGGLCGTASDLAAFGLAVARGDLLSRPIRDRMFRSQRLASGRPTGYGLGWHTGRRGRRRGPRREVWHAGNQPGAGTVLFLRPARGIAVCVLGNLEGAELVELARRIADVVDTDPGADPEIERPRTWQAEPAARIR